MSCRRLLAVVALFAWFCGPARAQEWPTRPVTMVVPFAPGGVYDTFGRVYAARLSEILHQPVIVENVPGAGGMTGAARVARADPDGYTFLFGGESPNSQSPLVNKEALYDPASDFAPVALMAIQPLILVARGGIPAGNLPDFIAYAKANQGKMQYGSPGTGTGSHLACALLNLAVGIEVTHVPYRGLGPALPPRRSRGSRISKSIAGTRHSCPRRRRCRSSTSSTPPRLRPWMSRRCRDGCTISAPARRRRSTGRRNICKVSFRPSSRNGAPPSRPPASPRSSEPQHDEFRFVVAAPLDLGEAFRRRERGFFRLLDDNQRVRHQPIAGARRGQRLFGKASAIGRIEEGERERLDRVRRPELGGVAAEDAGHAAEAERRDVLAQHRAGLRAVIDEQHES